MPSQQAPNTDFQRVAGYLRSSWTLTDGTSHTSPVTNAVATDWADTKFHSLVTLTVNNASGTFTFTIQGSIDAVDWYTIAGRVDASAAYSAAAVSIVGAGTAARSLAADDTWRYIRILPSAVGSAVVKVYCESI